MEFKGVSTGKITINQVPRSRGWMREIESTFKVAAALLDTGGLTIKGETQAICDSAMDAVKQRVKQEDFENALNIIHLMESHPHCEQFSIDTSLLSYLSGPTITATLKNYENVLKCVIKIDQPGQVSVFGDADSCHMVRQYIESQAQFKERTIGSNSSNGGAMVKIEGHCVFDAIDRAMAGNLVDMSEADNWLPSESVGANRIVLMSKDTLDVAAQEVGRVIGKQKVHQNYIESKYNCKIRIAPETNTIGRQTIIIEANSENLVEEAKEYLINYVKTKPLWGHRLDGRAGRASHSDSSQSKDFKAGGDSGDGGKHW